MKESFSQKHPLVWLYLFFIYFSGSFQLLLYTTGATGSNGLRQTILMGVIGLLPILLWQSKTKLIAAILGTVMLAASLASLGYWIIYGQEFSQSTIFIIFESNTAETREFLQSYFKWWQPIILFSFCFIPIAMWRKVSTIKTSLQNRLILISAFSFIIFWPLINTMLIKDNSLAEGKYQLMTKLEPVAPWNLVSGYIKYQNQLNAMNAILSDNSKLEPIKNLAELNSDKNKTFVLVIGESTNRNRMGLYGYHRDTSPMLNELRDELTIFDNVVTPRPFTIEALQQVLSFADSKHIDNFFDQPTLINMMQQADYEVTWITNQQTQTRRNTMLTTLSKMADKQVYLNNNRNQNAKQYDEAVLTPLQEALNSTAPKKMIVVHLLGTHRKYSYRYPESFQIFNSKDNTPNWISDDLLDEYNSYDNAILYNDMVVANIIQQLKAESGNNALIYLSDHGEEVFDTPDQLFTGRNELNPLPAMYTVPFIVWSNDEYKNNNPTENWKNYTNRPYSSADFIYTWATLTGISFEEIDNSRSLLSEQFIKHPRWIGDPNDEKSIKEYPFEKAST